MVDECVSAGIAVVVLSPFVMGGARSNRFAARYSHALRRHLPLSSVVHLLDAHALLSRERRSQMLLRDGFHLSARGHQIVGAALGQLLAQIALNGKWPKTIAGAAA
jgi:lysophospholipase L1-like esterase